MDSIDLQVDQALGSFCNGKTCTIKTSGGASLTGTVTLSTTLQVLTLVDSTPATWLIPLRTIVAATAA